MAYAHRQEEYVWRKGAGKQPALNKAIYTIGTYGVRGFDIKELKRIGRPIIKEVKTRMKLLEEAGLEKYSRAYEYVINHNLKISLAGDNINDIKHELVEAYNFLHTKTSTVEGTIEYRKWLNRVMGGDVTDENAKMIWALVHHFEDTNPEKFINYGYDEAIKTISTVARQTGYDASKTEALVREIFQRNLHFDFEDDIPKESEMSPWYKGGSFTKDL